MQPNVLLLLPDQHRGDWIPLRADVPEERRALEQFGIRELPLRMPNLRRLMDCGVTFTQAVTPSPLCAPARACLATGRRYSRCGVPDNGTDFTSLCACTPPAPTFYRALREQGYEVLSAGKLDLHKKTQYWGLEGWLDSLLDIGFTRAIDNAGKFDAARSGAQEPQDPYMAELHRHGMAKYHAEDLISRGQGVRPTALPDALYCDNWIGDNALRLLRDTPANRPWFLQVNFTGPHNPWDVTVSMRERWKDAVLPRPVLWPGGDGADVDGIRQNYAAMLENIDRILGLLLDYLRESGQLQNTVILYSSDHGEMLGDFGLFGKKKPQRGSIHIPLVIRTPEMASPRLDDSLVELQDLAPTILELCRARPIPLSNDDGVSLCPALKDGAHSAIRRCQVSEFMDWKVVQDARLKVLVRDGKLEAVYDRAADPFETENLLPRDPTAARAAAAMLPAGIEPVDMALAPAPAAYDA